MNTKNEKTYMVTLEFVFPRMLETKGGVTGSTKRTYAVCTSINEAFTKRRELLNTLLGNGFEITEHQDDGSGNFPFAICSAGNSKCVVKVEPVEMLEDPEMVAKMARSMRNYGEECAKFGEE